MEVSLPDTTKIISLSDLLEKVQQRAVTMVSGLKSGEYSERLSELGLTTLEERRHQADMARRTRISGSREQ